MRSNSVWWTSVLVAALALGVGPAWAAEPTSADREEAKRAYTEARTLTKEGKLVEALEKFRRAHELAPTPVTRIDLARALAGQGKLIEARDLAVSTPGMAVTATETQKSRDARRDARELVITLEERIPTLTLAIPADAGETEMAIDGRTLSKELLASAIPLDPGTHVVVTQRNGLSLERQVVLAEKERKTYPVELPSAPEPINTAPPTPVTPPPLAPRVEPPKEKPQTIPPEDDGVHPFVPVMFTIAGVSLLTGTITGAIAFSQASELKQNCPDSICPTAYHDELSTHRALATTSTIGFIVGGATTAAGAVGWIIDATTGESTTSSVRLRVAGTGFALEGQW